MYCFIINYLKSFKNGLMAFRHKDIKAEHKSIRLLLNQDY